MPSYTLTVPSHPPTLNKLMRGKIRDRIRLGKAFRDVACFYAKHSGIPPATTKRRVEITIVLPPGGRGADPDAYSKSAGDTLKHASMIKDDSRFWVEWAPVRYERGDVAETRFTLTDIE